LFLFFDLKFDNFKTGLLDALSVLFFVLFLFKNTTHKSVSERTITLTNLKTDFDQVKIAVHLHKYNSVRYWWWWTT